MAKKINQISEAKRKFFAKKIERVSITKRARDMFIMKYGLKDGIFKPNSAVGKKFGITEEGVRLSNKRVEALLK